MKKQVYFCFKVIFFTAVLSIGYAPHAKGSCYDCSLWFLPCFNINVFEDLNCNGVMDAGDAPISGVSIDVSGPYSCNSYTNVNGQISIGLPDEGDYSVTETDPSGYISVTPNIINITAKFEEQYYIYYGDTIPSSISGVVFEDSDGDGIQHPLDPLISGVTINLTGPESRSTTTSEYGQYSFSDIFPGDYIVTEIDPPGYFSTTSNEIEVTATSASWSSVIFGDFPDIEQMVSAGRLHNCGLKMNGTVVCWGAGKTDTGDPHFGQSTLPVGTFIQISAGGYHTCAIKADGTVTCWGYNIDGQSTPSSGIFTQISAGGYHNCGLRVNETVDCWGYNGYGNSTPPDGTFTQLSAGTVHTCGIQTDGTVVCWGAGITDTEWPHHGQSTPPEGTFTQISAGGYHTCGIKTDGTVVCWGNNDSGQSNPPLGKFIKISAGEYHTCGIETDGTVVCWGTDVFGQSTPPGGIFNQISGGYFHTCGEKTDGTVICWGRDNYGQAPQCNPMSGCSRALPWLMLLLN